MMNSSEELAREVLKRDSQIRGMRKDSDMWIERERGLENRIEQLESALHKIMSLADDGASLKLIYDGAEEALNK